jgi:hypothetical protein
MSVLSVFLNTEKVIVTFVSLSFDRMSSETREAINGHCARDRSIGFRLHRFRLEVLSNDRLSLFSLYSRFQMVCVLCLSVCLSGCLSSDHYSALTSFNVRELTSLNHPSEQV